MSQSERRWTDRMGIGLYPDDTTDEPYYRVLSDEKLERLHDATAEVLERAGIQVALPETVEMLHGAGGLVDGDIVRIPRALLEDSIQSAPKRITIYDREGNEALDLGSSAMYTHSGYTPLDFFDFETGELRDYTLDDFRTVATVVDALPNVDAVGQSGVVRPSAENPLEVINHLEFEIMMTYSSKPLHALVADAVILKDCLEMAEAVAVANGAKSLSEKPFVMAFLNCISPLIYNDDTIEKLLLSVDMGIPFICGPAPLAGGTSPVTMAGTIVQNNAERLAGLVIAQVRKKGAPVVMSGTGAVLDMMSGESVYSPQRVLMAAGALELGHYYGVPVQSGSVQGNSGQCAKGILDAEMGWQQMLSGMNVALLRGNAGASVGAGQSLETCVLADEIVGILKATVMQGIKVDDDSLAVDAICEIGPGGGTFLGHPHTYMHFGEQWRPGLIPWQRHREWVETGSKTTMDHIKERVDHILSTHQPKPLPEAVKPKIAEIIDRARARVPAPSAAD